MNITNLPGETWVSISPNYSLSNLGRVYSIPRMGSKGGLLTLYMNKQGYPVVKLTHNNRSRSYPIHLLLGRYFIPNPDNKPWVLHKNDIKTNYTLENLYWGNPSDNTYDRWENGYYTRVTYSFYTDTGKLITTNNLSKWCKDNNIPKSRVTSSIHKNRVVTTTPGKVDRYGNPRKPKG